MKRLSALSKNSGRRTGARPGRPRVRVLGVGSLVLLGCVLSSCSVVQEIQRSIEAQKQRQALARRLANLLSEQPFQARRLYAGVYQSEESPDRIQMIYNFVNATGGASSFSTCVGSLETEAGTPQVVRHCEVFAWWRASLGPYRVTGSNLLHNLLQAVRAEESGEKETDGGCNIMTTLQMNYEKVARTVLSSLQTQGWQVVQVESLRDKTPEGKEVENGYEIKAFIGNFHMVTRVVQLPTMDQKPLTAWTVKAWVQRSKEDARCEELQPPADRRVERVVFKQVAHAKDGLIFYFTVPGQSVQLRRYQLQALGGQVGYAPVDTVRYPVRGALVLSLGEGYEQRYNERDIILILRNYIDIPFASEVERAQRLDAELQAAQQQLQTAPSVLQQYQTARQIRQTLEELIRIHTQLRSPPTVIAQYRQRLEAINAQIAQIEPQARQEQLQGLQQQMTESLREEDQIRAGLQSPPRTARDVEQQQELLKKWETNLEARQQLIEELRTLQALNPEAEQQLQKSQQDLEAQRQRLEKVARQFELRELERQYSEMDQRRRQLYGQLARVIGTPQERAVGAQIVDLLKKMIANRQRALQLGHTPAGEAVRLLQNELNKIISTQPQ